MLDLPIGRSEHGAGVLAGQFLSAARQKGPRAFEKGEQRRLLSLFRVKKVPAHFTISALQVVFGLDRIVGLNLLSRLG